MKGIALYLVEARKLDIVNEKADEFIMNGLSPPSPMRTLIRMYLWVEFRNGIKAQRPDQGQILRAGSSLRSLTHDAAHWKGDSLENLKPRPEFRDLATEDEDIRS